ncbi:hypothetical protein [Anaerocolumna aminovalerica]|nr:hypothetical protein [Anaerocolumna aminovalerica]
MSSFAFIVSINCSTPFITKKLSDEYLSLLNVLKASIYHDIFQSFQP